MGGWVGGGQLFQTRPKRDKNDKPNIQTSLWVREGGWHIGLMPGTRVKHQHKWLITIVSVSEEFQ